jgi:hypothetical protein
MKALDKINYEADKGKVFIRKSDGNVMGFGIGLGSKDSIENYYEADCPAEYKGMEGYDNTITDNEEVDDEIEPNIIDFPAPRIVS